MTSTTNNGATVDNLNVLDTITADNSGGAEIIELQDVANALFPSTNATQTLTIDNTFWSDNLSLTFQAAGSGLYYTLKATGVDNFTLVQTDKYGNAVSGAATVTFSANSASTFLSAFSTKLQLISTGLTSTSLLTALDITGGVGKNVFQATLNGQIANIFSYASANDSFNGTGSQWDVINNFNEGVDKLDFRSLINDTTIVGSEGGHTASNQGLGAIIWRGQEPANTTSLGSAGAYSVWYTTDGRLDDAIALYRQAIALAPAHAAAHENLAVALTAKGELDAAADACRGAIAANPASADAFVDRASAHEMPRSASGLRALRIGLGDALNEAGDGTVPSVPQKGEVNVPVSVGELLDKITILAIKTERMIDLVKLENVHRELELLQSAREQGVQTNPMVDAMTRELKSVNERLWDIEDEIRECERERDFSARFVELARAVYKTNDRRAEIKKQINLLVGSGIIEEKSYSTY